MNLGMIQNIQFMKEIIDKLVFIKLKTSGPHPRCTELEHLQEVIRNLL